MIHEELSNQLFGYEPMWKWILRNFVLATAIYVFAYIFVSTTNNAYTKIFFPASISNVAPNTLSVHGNNTVQKGLSKGS
jgi:hypothetical protein